MAWSKWYLIETKSGTTIRRYMKVDGKVKWDRLPKEQYKDLNPHETQALVRRLNATYEIKAEEARKRYDFDHAYVNATSIAQFETFLNGQANDRDHIKHSMHVLNEYVFKFFIIKHKLPDPNQWHRKESEWGQWLLNQKLKIETVKKYVGIANRFIDFLVERVYPEMSNPRRLKPIGKAKIAKKKIEEKKASGSKLIEPKTYQAILKWFKEKDPEVAPAVELCYRLGLRCAEVQGLTRTKFFKDYVLVNEQGARFTSGKMVLKEVKTLDQRKTPYWYITAKEAWSLVQDLKPMNPSTLNRRINAGLAKYGHTSHHFRATFITKALKEKHWRDVQGAVGHKDPRTTMGYAQDDRAFEDELAELD